ncbi:hypothetical protein HYZ97_03920 [Candidatus Pacearchaeota archaeon]|nr:hypothetical protein [Candidatus Pacearchaeota archaeon]
MSKTFTITCVQGNRTREITIEELASDKQDDKELLGTPVGKDLAHCFYLGVKYSPRFIERVGWYYIHPEVTGPLRDILLVQPESVQISFYAERK